MISILISNAVLEDTNLLRSATTELFFNYKDEFRILIWDMTEDIQDTIEKVDTLEAAIIDVTQPRGIDGAKEIRRKYDETEILIVSNPSISPILYLNPEVRATSLLLKPLTKDEVLVTFKDFFKKILEGTTGSDYFVISKKNEQIRVPYNRILYFEARDKKIYIRLNNVEYAVGETIDHLLEILPEEFIRCHRSYVVNTSHIENVSYSDNQIILSGDMDVPLSRSYKTAVKEVMRNV